VGGLFSYCPLTPVFVACCRHDPIFKGSTRSSLSGGYRTSVGRADGGRLPAAAADADLAARLRQALTDREQDVFSRIAAGLSNSEIAASLFLSEGTVKIHVGRILAKLGLRDRVQAVVLAYESRLVTPGTDPRDGPAEPH
jgi:DNA-binding NarL/FixJ family response regulator